MSFAKVKCEKIASVIGNLTPPLLVTWCVIS